MESNDTSVKCNNCGSSFINRQRRRKHYQKCQPIVNSESGPEASNDAVFKEPMDKVWSQQYNTLHNTIQCSMVTTI